MELKPHTFPNLDPITLPVRPILKVIGLGGGGCNAINRMIELGLSGVEFIACNTDHQALKNSLAPTTIHLGPRVTRGLGAGGNPEVGEAAAQESTKEIAAAVAGADLVFLTAGMGGGTGTGSIPVVAEIARRQGAVTIAVVTTPFSFEMGKRQRNASQGLAKLNQYTDTLIAISNDRLLHMKGGNITIDVAFRVADDVLRQAIQGITELIIEPGLINVDFAHIRRLMKMGGGAFLGIGQGQGEDKAAQAIHKALNHPLLESISLEHASGILVNFTGGSDLSLFEVNQALCDLQASASPDTEIVMGVIQDERMTGRTQTILIVTGLGGRPLEEVLPGAERLNKPFQASQPQPQAAVQAAAMKQAVSSTAAVVPPVETAPMQPASEPLSFNNPINTTNLDLPAFLRRPRYMGQANQQSTR